MWIGDVVEDRFVVERPIGSGGMGSVFCAVDRVAGGTVALKVMDVVSKEAAERFEREARVLSELSHPGIVRYVAHGETGAREPFLAMELLEGEDLAVRLGRGGLSFDESVRVVRRAAEALAFAHERGVVHRDVKPSNLFLVNGDVDRVKVLDFGIARAHARTQGLTRTGALLGTVGYMAPEQAMGARDVDARADVFALGCLLFECLAGRAAFAGDHAVAVLAKVLTEQAPRLRELRPEVGSAMDALVASMLAKRPEDRPADAAAVVVGLAACESTPDTRPPSTSVRSSSIAQREQRVVSAILIESRVEASSLATLTMEEAARHNALVRSLASRFGGEFTPVQGGAGVCLFSGQGTPMDQAVQAASCALALGRECPDLRASLATGRAETNQRLPIGRAIDAAAALLREPAVQPEASGIPTDELTAALLSHRFELRWRGATRLIVGERRSDLPRLLMGRPTPTVGREKELGLLELTLDECSSDRVARAVVVTAPPGVGKSRLLSAFVGKARARGVARVFVARGEAVAAGSPLAVVEGLVREAAGLPDSSAAFSHARLREYLTARVASDKLDKLAEFLGEIVGAPTDREPSGLLRAARNDPTIMREQKRRAFEAWIDAETVEGVLVLALEDLHWADPPSIAYLDEALQRCRDRSLMVIALARPEVHDVFPGLWARAEPHQIRLGGLTRRAAERLVRCALGDDVAPDVVTAVVERADGNAFYLEELIRFTAEGGSNFPDTVVAMAQSRLERLEPEARQVLRGASVAGQVSWAACVASLTGESVDAAGWLEALVERELLVRAPVSRFPGEVEYAFRHALLRDAAYAMLTDEDRALAHQTVAVWLERTGEQDARALANHYELGGDVARALHFIGFAVRAALESADITVDALARHGIELGAEGPALGGLLLLRAIFLGWANRFEEALASATKSAALLEGSADWWLAVGVLFMAAGVVGRPEEAMPLAQRILAAPPAAEPTGPFGVAIQALVSGLVWMGETATARLALRNFGLDGSLLSGTEPAHAAMLNSARSVVELAGPADGSDAWNLGLAWQAATNAVAFAEESGHPGIMAATPFWLGVAEVELGRPREAEAAFSLAMKRGAAIGADWISEGNELYLVSVPGGSTPPAVAREVLRRAHQAKDAQVVGISFVFASELDLKEGRLVEALANAQHALAKTVPLSARFAAVTMARVQLAQGDPAGALETLARAHSTTCRAWARVDTWEAVIQAEALHALGDHQAAHAAIGQAGGRIQRTLAGISVSELRESFVNLVEWNRRVLELAKAWGVSTLPVAAHPTT